MLKKSRVDGKWPDGHFLNFTNLCQDNQNLCRATTRRRDVSLLRLIFKAWIEKKIGSRKYYSKLPRAAFVLQDFVQRPGQLSSAPIELAGQQVIFLFQDVVFVGDIQRGQHGQTQGIDGAG